MKSVLKPPSGGRSAQRQTGGSLLQGAGLPKAGRGFFLRSPAGIDGSQNNVEIQHIKLCKLKKFSHFCREIDLEWITGIG